LWLFVKTILSLVYFRERELLQSPIPSHPSSRHWRDYGMAGQTKTCKNEQREFLLSRFWLRRSSEGAKESHAFSF